MFEITCKELTPQRRRNLTAQETVSIGKTVRSVIAVGGAWLFYYATSDVPAAMKNAAVAFAVIGIVLVVYAIFSQKFTEMFFISKAKREDSFPAGVSIGEGGLFIRYREGKKAPGVTSVNADRFFAFGEVGKVEDREEFLKINLLRAGTPRIFLFKEDFVDGTPEALAGFIASRTKR